MHIVKSAARRRKAGLVAGVVLAGGLAGGVLLTPGTAFAAVGTTTVITGVTQTLQSSDLSNVHVSVTVEAGAGSFAPGGSFTVSNSYESCNVNLQQIGATANSDGSCTLDGVAAGTYLLHANYAGANGFDQSSQETNLTVGAGPAFTADSPSLSATNGGSYTYNFNANGNPAPTYALSGAPGWLSINTSTGAVSGTVPNGINSFTYSVLGSNSVANTTVGPFTVKVSNHGQHGSKLSTSLSCTSPVHSGARGTCTLDVTNNGWNSAPSVTGTITLPAQLKADHCGHGWNWGWYNLGCSLNGNTASENLGTLRAGQTKTVTVTFTAQSTHWLWGWGHQYREVVHVTGSAHSQYGNWGWLGLGGSHSSASSWVRILPPHWFW